MRPWMDMAREAIEHLAAIRKLLGELLEEARTR